MCAAPLLATGVPPVRLSSSDSSGSVTSDWQVVEPGSSWDTGPRLFSFYTRQPGASNAFCRWRPICGRDRTLLALAWGEEGALERSSVSDRGDGRPHRRAEVARLQLGGGIWRRASRDDAPSRRRARRASRVVALTRVASSRAWGTCFRSVAALVSPWVPSVRFGQSSDQPVFQIAGDRVSR